MKNHIVLRANIWFSDGGGVLCAFQEVEVVAEVVVNIQQLPFQAFMVNWQMLAVKKKKKICIMKLSAKKHTSSGIARVVYLFHVQEVFED